MTHDYVEIDDPIITGGICFMAGAALCALGHFEAAAVLTGKFDSIESRIGPDWAQQQFATTDAALLAALGEQQVAALAARGAALDATETFEYIRVHARLVLDAE